MNKNLIITLLGIALVVSLVFLLGGGLTPVDPPPDPTPPPTPTPTPEKEKTCEYRTIQFKWEEIKKTGKYAIFAYPEKLYGVQDCAEVIFINLTDKEFTIKFENIESEYGPLFRGVGEISLEANQEGNQFSECHAVDVVLPPNNEVFVEFPYIVEPDGPPQEDQSPRIRVGPRSADE